jgi:hypothetical protein
MNKAIPSTALYGIVLAIILSISFCETVKGEQKKQRYGFDDYGQVDIPDNDNPTKIFESVRERRLRRQLEKKQQENLEETNNHDYGYDDYNDSW